MAKTPDQKPRLTIVQVDKPSLELATLAQHIGYEAWKDAMPHRGEQVRNVFDPQDPEKAERLLKKMKAKIGLFSGVVAELDGVPVGYAWGTDDVGNMSKAGQWLKTNVAAPIKGKTPFAVTTQINVLPAKQGIGIGSSMEMELLASFPGDRRASTYVFDENRAALGWFVSRGFGPRPDHPVDPRHDDPNGPDMYFGPGAKHVEQWRLEAATVEETIALYGAALGANAIRYQVI